MRLKFTLFIFSMICFTAVAQDHYPKLEYYLPDDVTYDESIPKPQDILGWVPGTWHVSHDKLADYMRQMADASPRIKLVNRGTTFEGRPILLLIITSPENHVNLEEIRKAHVALNTGEGTNADLSQMPVVTYQGMSIHGNEPSGSNAGLLAAYYLAAAKGQKIEAILKNTVILFDPSFNPDGLQRFAHWANSNKAINVNTDPQDREYDETWPGGRTNHYWFDLNRDWLPVQLPESRARIKTFHEWYPNILTDHHEMGSNSSFFFQPGIPSRTHPLTPKLNQQLTQEIGTYHAKALDKIGSLYYTEEDYDDFYYGKGSTFPDINGSIGILFEQASSRGHAQETDNGVLTFPFTIRNQFATFLSTIEAANSMREKLLNYQRDFYSDERNAAGKDAYFFGSKDDPARAYHLAEILDRQGIKIQKPSKNFKINGKEFNANASYVVPKNQMHSIILKAMFETRTTFQDSLFYDISAWSFPMAFDLDFADNASTSLGGETIENLAIPEGQLSGKSNYAYLLHWEDYYAPKALNKLLNAGIRAKVAMQPFTSGGKEYDYGTIMFTVQNQNLNADEIYSLVQEITNETPVKIDAASTGLTPNGIDFGSRQFEPVKPVKVGLIVGEGITYADAGEIWHLFDTRYDMVITKLDTKNLGRDDLSKYTDIILPNAWGSAIDDNASEALKTWVKLGGNLIGYRNAARWLSSNNMINVDFVPTSNPAKNISFEQRDEFSGAQVIGGAIFKAKLDRSHPVNFGMGDDNLFLFRNTTLFIEADDTSYKNPIQYTDDPLASGYISKINLEAIKNTRPFVQQRYGRGSVIIMTDNTNFRSFWYGTNKLLMNAIFFDKAM